MPTPIDLASLSLNLGVDGSPRQRLETLLSQAGLAPPVAIAPSMSALDGSAPGIGYLSDRLHSLNGLMSQYGLHFELSEFDSRVITQVIDRTTGDIIRQIPAEEMLRLAEAFAENQGRLVDASA
ncbi:MAG: flagellar protein FlaG [Salinicola sp.]|uniref:flagellar protein FlaG n=1 Tax=Salinicola sp. TaxID=1978524 RepID=UPI001D8AFC1C|nr:flagellar protein FlaG [Salinicola sp.]NRB58031.1 flagellar protein FlaG [Salinicola sp.]